MMDTAARPQLDPMEALCEQYALPSIDLAAFAPQQDAIRLVHHTIARKLRVLPLSRVGSVLTIVLSEPNLSTIDALRFATGLCVETVLAPADEIHAAITRFYNVEPVIGQQASLVADVKLEVETRSYGEEAAAAFDQRSGALVQAALHGPHVTRHVHQRRNVAHSWYVGSLENQPSYEQAIADALRAMSGGGK